LIRWKRKLIRKLTFLLRTVIFRVLFIVNRIANAAVLRYTTHRQIKVVGFKLELWAGDTTAHDITSIKELSTTFPVTIQTFSQYCHGYTRILPINQVC